MNDILENSIPHLDHFLGLHQRVIEKICRDLQNQTLFNSPRNLELSNYCQFLIQSTQQQNQFLESILNLSRIIDVSAQDPEIQEASEHLQEMVIEPIKHIVETSKQTMILIYILDDAIKTLSKIEENIQGVVNQNNRNKKTLTEEIPQSSQAIASKVKDLSQNIHYLAVNIREYVTHMAHAVNQTHDHIVEPQENNSEPKGMGHLDQMLQNLLHNNYHMTNMIEESAIASHLLSKKTHTLIEDTHEHLREDLEYITTTLHSLQDLATTLKNNHTKNYGESFFPAMAKTPTLSLIEDESINL